MKPFANLDLRPAQSAIEIESAESGTTLLFPGMMNFRWILVLYAIGVGFLLWKWQGVVHLVQGDGQAWDDKGIIRPVLLGVLSIAMATLFLFGRHKLEVTSDGICRSLSVFGMNILKSKVQFNGIADITADTQLGGPVIWVYPNGVKRFCIEFPSVEERDWVAEELKRLWRNAVGDER